MIWGWGGKCAAGELPRPLQEGSRGDAGTDLVPLCLEQGCGDGGSKEVPFFHRRR